MRVSIRDLLGLMVFVAVIVWSGTIAGFDNQVYWYCALAVATFSFLFVVLANGQRSRTLAWSIGIIPALTCFLPTGFGSPVLLCLGVLHIAFGAACAMGQVPRSTVVTGALICAAVASSVGPMLGFFGLRDLRIMRDQFPVVSLDERLAYESRVVKPTPPTLTPVSQNRLADLDAQTEGGLRTYMLSQLHRAEYERFIRQSGFGVSRMLRPQLKYLQLDLLQEIPFAGHPGPVSTTKWPLIEASPELTDMHTRGTLDFVNGIGYVFRGFDSKHNPPTPSIKRLLQASKLTGRRLVAGFVEHGFRRPLTSGESMSVLRMELVSLLRFKQPQVYLLEQLPRMDKLRGNDVPTRNLDAFEKQALAKLRSGLDIVSATQGRYTRMLGSLRAGESCRRCHSRYYGELLGAFSYVLESQP